MQAYGKTLLFTSFALGAALTAPAYAQCGASMAPRASVAYQAMPSPALAGPRAAVADAKSAPSDKPDNLTMVGLWKEVFVSQGAVVDQAFDIWHSDGTETLNDTPPPATGNVCLGVWSQNGNSYKLNHPSWTFDNNGNLNGTAVIKETVAVGPHGNTFSGTFTVDVYDLSGKLLAHLSGTITGERITAD